MQHRQERNDGVHEQDADMNNDDKEKQSPRRKEQLMMQTETARGKDYHP